MSVVNKYIANLYIIPRFFISYNLIRVYLIFFFTLSPKSCCVRKYILLICLFYLLDINEDSLLFVSCEWIGQFLKQLFHLLFSYRINRQELRNRKNMYRGWSAVRLSYAKHAT